MDGTGNTYIDLVGVDLSIYIAVLFFFSNSYYVERKGSTNQSTLKSALA